MHMYYMYILIRDCTNTLYLIEMQYSLFDLLIMCSVM